MGRFHKDNFEQKMTDIMKRLSPQNKTSPGVRCEDDGYPGGGVRMEKQLRMSFVLCCWLKARVHSEDLPVCKLLTCLPFL